MQEHQQQKRVEQSRKLFVLEACTHIVVRERKKRKLQSVVFFPPRPIYCLIIAVVINLFLTRIKTNKYEIFNWTRSGALANEA